MGMQVTIMPNFKHVRYRPCAVYVRQLFVITGVFLFLGLSLSPIVFASNSEPQENTANIFQIEIKAQEMGDLNDALKSKSTLIEEKDVEFLEAKRVADESQQTKDLLLNEVELARQEVENLKAQIAEKARIESLRVVTPNSFAANSNGNTYAAGNCTWYAKSKRPDLPNRMGNAKYWLGAAKAQGFKTGSIAKKNAIAVSTKGWAGHVAFVDEWYDNGTVKVSEMNWTGLYNISTRVTNESEFMYIYEK